MLCPRALPREPFRVQHLTRSPPTRIVASASKPAVRLHLHLHRRVRLRLRLRRQAAAEGLDSLSAAIPSRLSLTRPRPRQVALHAQHHVSWAARLPHTVAACQCLHISYLRQRMNTTWGACATSCTLPPTPSFHPFARFRISFTRLHTSFAS
jgi:hypothetical protein